MENQHEKYITEFESHLHDAMFERLSTAGKIDSRMPDMPDIEECWEKIARSYLPDGVKEFTNYPLVSLGWMMYIGMAIAHLWDEDWEKYSKDTDIYMTLRDKRGYDTMDEYIREEVLGMKGEAYSDAEKFVGNISQTVHHTLMREHLEPATSLAFHAYVACLHQMYLFGAAVELYALGYKMHKV